MDEKSTERFRDAIPDTCEILMAVCHDASVRAGWWTNPKTNAPFTPEEVKGLFATKIALCHSELSEALEGDRKDLMDDHLPHRKMAEVELADALIRIFDLAGAMQFDIGSALKEKLVYNASRADHKLANRTQAGGKTY